MENTRENKMGTMPINRLLLSLSLPMVGSMLVQALYNIVDSVFVSMYNADAFTAVSLAFPLQNLMIAFATGTGVGINALLSKSLGEKNFERANKAANHGILLALVHYVIFLLIGIFATRAFFSAQSSDIDVINYGVEYASICLIASIGIFMQITMERLLLATGKSMLSMTTQLSGAVINIIMDPLLIFGIGPFPEMGAAGAALATVSGQIVAAFMGIFFNRRYNKEIHVTFRNFKPDMAIIKRIYAVGLPSTVMASITSVMTFGINKILTTFPSIVNDAQSVFGAYYKLQSFIFMPVFGLNNGMVPIVAYNYGAKKPDRMKKTIRLSVIYAVSIMIIGLLAFTLIPEILLGFFNTNTVLGVPAFRAISLSFVFAGFCIITGSVLQAVGNGFLSMCTSIVRQLVVLLPAAYLLSLTGNVNLVWFSFPIAEIASLIMSIIFLRHVYKTIINPLYD
ncbi:MAG: MATE family efflux transporter [Clostridia bacterium]|nr:MATE family efflux transporter [Clostridia bacterium]